MGSFSVPGTLLNREDTFVLNVESLVPKVLNSVRKLKTRTVDPKGWNVVANEITISENYTGAKCTMLANSITINGAVTNTAGGSYVYHGNYNDSGHERKKYLLIADFFNRGFDNINSKVTSTISHAFASNGIDYGLLISNYEIPSKDTILCAPGFFVKSSTDRCQSGGITLIIGNMINISGTVTANDEIGGIILILGKNITISGTVNASAGGKGWVAVLGESVSITGDVTGGKATIIETVKW